MKHTLVILALVCGACAPAEPAAAPAARAGTSAAASASGPVRGTNVPPAAPEREPVTAPEDGPGTAAPAAAPIAWPDPAAPSLAFRWHVKLTKAGETKPRCRWDWYLWRTGDRIESLETHGNTGEAWARDAAGRVSSHERLFHTDRKVVEYQPGDLSALGVSVEWDRVVSVIDPRGLGTVLKPGATADYRGTPAETYAGRSGEVDLAVTWLPALRAPARIVRTTPRETLEFELRAVHPSGEAPWPRPRPQRYDHVDYADIGDRSTDPFFRKLIASGGVFGVACNH